MDLARTSNGRRVAVTAIVFLSLCAAAVAQSSAPRTAKPRIRVDPETGLPPGTPDFRGVWTNRWIVNMADGRFVEKTVDVPLNDKGRAVYAERTANLQKDDPNTSATGSTW